MLAVAADRLGGLGPANWSLAAADHRQVPAPTGMADIAISGWSICCLAVYTGPDWRKELDAGLREMRRVLAPGGTIILIETLGTGFFSPQAPEGLKAYYEVLSEKGFRSTWIRTDYRFQGREEAVELTRFFFGDEPLPALIADAHEVILPECTGIWWTTREELLDGEA
jgi:ubiquinone/menaquinone biosynthesis C-methylase UbiE